MGQSDKFWDRRAERYSKQPIADEAAYHKKLKATREHLRPDMQVLEFGCGTGSTALLHAPYVKHIHAIDASAKMIEIAQGKAEAEHVENVTFEQASIEEFSPGDRAVDAVLGLSILHLLEDRDDVIARVHGMLERGGVFTEEELKASLIAAGFEIDYRWQPGSGKAVFIVAKKAEEAGAVSSDNR